MANEIAVTCSLTASKGGMSVSSVGSSSPASATFDMTGVDGLGGTQATSTTTTALNVGSVAAPYTVMLRNMSTDSLEIITVGLNTPLTQVCTELKSGRPPSLLNVPSGATLYVLAATGTPTLAFTMVEA